MSQRFIVGTRASELATTQTGMVVALLRMAAPEATFDLVTLKTHGDVIQGAKELREAGVGVFVKELENALVENRIDIAVHSAKDLPSLILEGLVLGAIPEREDVRDLFIGRPGVFLSSLPTHAVIGTASLRRQAFLRAMHPGISLRDLRGNLDTRLRKLKSRAEGLSGIVVAAAGVNRLGTTLENPGQPLNPEEFVPAPAQGALAVEVRAKDLEHMPFLKEIHHTPTAIAIGIERSVLGRMEGGCHVPLGVWAKVEGDGRVKATACLSSLDGKRMIRATAVGTVNDSEKVAQELEDILRREGAADILKTLPRRG